MNMYKSLAQQGLEDSVKRRQFTMVYNEHNIVESHDRPRPLWPMLFSCMTDPHSRSASWLKLQGSFPASNLYSFVWVFHQFLLLEFEVLWCTEAIRTSSAFFSTRHSLAISVVALHSMSFFFTVFNDHWQFS